MEIKPTELNGVYVIQPGIIKDVRGYFVKIFNEQEYMKHELDFDLKEHYYTASKYGVVRGMHFQIPPHDHNKIVYILYGNITDAVLDLRKESATFQQHISLELNETNRNAVYIPKGCAHGFLVKSEYAIVAYLQSSFYVPEHNKGILWNSFGMEWGVDEPILSDRDKGFSDLKEFESPF